MVRSAIVIRIVSLILAGMVASSLAFAESYKVSLLTGGPQVWDVQLGRYAGNAWLYARGIDDAGIGIGYYYSSNPNPPVASSFEVQNLHFSGIPSNPLQGPQQAVTAISSNGLYTAGLYEPMTAGQGNSLYIQQGSSAPQKLALPPETFGFGMAPSTSIRGINNSGTAVADLQTWTNGVVVNTAEVIRQGRVTQLQFPGAIATSISGINNNGVIVGNATVLMPNGMDNFVTFTYQNGVFQTVYSTPYTNHIFWAIGINDKRQIVGQIAPFDRYSEHAGLLENGVLTDLNTYYTSNPYPLYYHQFAYAAGINNLGEIIGGDPDGSILVAMPTSLTQTPEQGGFGLAMVFGGFAVLGRWFRKAE